MLEQLANKAAQNLVSQGEDKEFALDPSTVFTFIELITGVISMLKDCKQSSVQARQKITSPTLRDKLALKIYVRRELGSRKEFRQHNGQKIVQALFNTGTGLTQAEVDEAFNEV